MEKNVKGLELKKDFLISDNRGLLLQLTERKLPRVSMFSLLFKRRGISVIYFSFSKSFSGGRVGWYHPVVLVTIVFRRAAFIC